MTDRLTCFDEYQEKSILTMKLDSPLMEILHCVMGMVGEAGEVKELHFSDTDKMVGEVGDCMWYAAVLAHRLGLHLSDVVADAQEINALHTGPFSCLSGEDRALVWACRLNDLVKKSVFYSRELDRATVQTQLTHYWAALLSLCAKMSVAPLYVATTNVRKLEARFPDKMFNAAHAKNRDCLAESVAAGIELV